MESTSYTWKFINDFSKDQCAFIAQIIQKKKKTNEKRSQPELGLVMTITSMWIVKEILWDSSSL